MKPRHPALLFALLALPVVAGGDRLSAPAASSPAQNQAPMPAFAQGQILNLDSSGKISSAQQASDVQIILGDAVSTSSAGLVQESLPGGGYMVNLQGRFQNAMTMTIDDKGNIVESPCVPAEEVPATSNGKVK